MNNKKSMFVALFWLEYLAEKSSSSNGRVNCFEYSDDFVKRPWISYKVNFETCTDDNFFYLKDSIIFYGKNYEDRYKKKYKFDILAF